MEIILPKVHFKDPSGDVARELFRWKGAIVNGMARYPAQLPQVTYKRTGDYGSGWKFRVERDEAIVFNRIAYASYLGGPTPRGVRKEGDAARWARSYGWPALLDVSKKPTQVLQDQIGKKLRRSIKFG
jgi:hypothetical protein